MIEEKIFNFNEHVDERGGLVALENPKDIPFAIKRVYYIYNVPGDIPRGFHSHKKLQQVLICLGGSVKIKLKTPEDEKIILLDKPNKGLFIDKMVWREMFDFSENATLLVLASMKYNEKDYIRDYNEYERKYWKLKKK